MAADDTLAQVDRLREADRWDIDDAFRTMGRLWGAEQQEADDEGVGYVERLTAMLREFKTHEDAEDSDEPDCCTACCGVPCCC